MGRGADLTRQLLAFARKQIVRPCLIDVGQSVTKMRGMLARLIKENISLEIEVDSELSLIEIDPGQLEQLILNLALNARDAMPTGGQLGIHVRQVSLDESFTSSQIDLVPGEYVMLAVSDSGCGIPSAIQTHLFEPFYTTKEDGSGTGLGLSMVYGIIKQAGGAIKVYSEARCGTVFKAFFPARDGAPARSVDSEPRPDTSSGTETILLVEDEDSLRRVTARMLARRGYQVLQAPNGEVAMGVLGTQRVDVLVTDLVMPLMSGAELAQQARRLNPQISIVYTSGYSGTTTIRHELLQENASFMQKPFSTKDLASTIRGLLPPKATS